MGKKDIQLKKYMNLEKFADAINAIVFKGKQVVDHKKLTPIDVDTVYSKRKKNGYVVNERFRDKIRMAELDDAIYCIFGIENQSREAYEMPLRIMEYEVREYCRK